MSSIEQKEESKGNSGQVEKIKAYRQKVEKELSEVCNDILAVLDQHLIPNAQVGFAGSGFGGVRGRGVLVVVLVREVGGDGSSWLT